MHPEIRMNQALAAIKAFRSGQLAAFLPGHFKNFPKMGSRDRKEVGNLVFDYFRVARLFPNQAKEMQVLLGRYLCTEVQDDFFVQFWSQRLTGKSWPCDVKSRWEALSVEANWQSAFPVSENISPMLDHKALQLSLLQQPALWVRVKKGKEAQLIKALDAAAIAYNRHPNLEQAFSVAAGTRLEALPIWQQGHIEIQDIASQRTLELMQPKAGERWLDACAGAGGKSLLLHDTEPGISLFVTDVRDAILKNLHERFKRAGIRSYSQAVVDHTVMGALAQQKSFPKQFDVILADVPCSGSGTWSATPEAASQFNPTSLAEFADKQYRIARQLAYALKGGGRLIYLTCSVYATENEDVVNKLAELPELTLVELRYFQESANGGDVLFGAVFRKR